MCEKDDSSVDDGPLPMNHVGRRPRDPVHLGDGAYARFDGYHLWLSAGSHDSWKKVALEPQAFLNLLEYVKSIWVLPP